MKQQAKPEDVIDRIRRQWVEQLPEIDTSPLETIGRVLRVHLLAEAEIRRTLREHALDIRGFDVLATLRRSGAPFKMTPTHLYRELALTSGAMTHLMDALERARFLKRAPDPADRRGTLAMLTRRGRDVVQKAMRAHMEREAEMVAPLSRPERIQLAQLLKKILLALEMQDAGH